MRFGRSLPLALALLLLSGCGAESERPAPEGDVLGSTIARSSPAGSAETTALAQGLNRFGFELYADLAREAEGDIVFSPLSIGIAFGMADAGARGETAAQIESVFHHPARGEELHTLFNTLTQAIDRKRPATVRLANRIFPARDFAIEQAFVETLASKYGAPLERLGFAGDPEAARRRINGWVSQRTARRIPELFPQGSIRSETVLALVNATYLEATWRDPFGKYPTRDAPFTRLDGSKVSVPLMQNAELPTRFADGEDVQAVELPYRERNLSLLVLVPKLGTFEAFESSLGPGRVDEIDRSLEKGVVDLHLPRWESRYEIELVEKLRALGLTLPFEGGDFTGVSPTNPPIDAALHAAVIEVDEEGTVAAAATGTAFATSGPPPPDARIRVDRPFLYLIRERTSGAVLFLGRVVDPAA